MNSEKSFFNFVGRKQAIRQFKNLTYDLIIVGGGIVGAGIARDAASRGMRVALVEKNDFANGTSSKSSKLIHGGIRYLENLEFGLVFEALSEREKLYSIAPTLVHPIRFVLPVYKDSRVSFRKMGLGMWLYDILSLFQGEMHETLTPEETSRRCPPIKSDDLSGSYVYSDAYMEDDRLTIETLHSAHQMGANIANFVEALEPIWSGCKTKITGLKCKDKLTQQDFEIKGAHVISCVGPWTDDFGPKLLSDWKHILRPTKGVHITLKKDRLNLTDAVVMAVDKESRIVFAIPRHEMVIIGTTDTDYKEAPEAVAATKQDVEYLLKITNEYFPAAKITTNDIIATYAGVRPLVKDESESEGKTSREHTFIQDPRGCTFVAGGKYTTYRLIAEQAVDLCLKDFDVEQRIRFGKSKTDEPLFPAMNIENLSRAKNLSHVWTKNSHLSQEHVDWLIQRYGLGAESLIKIGQEQHWSIWEIELYYAIHNTMCINLIDFYTRRVPLFLAESDHGLRYLDLLALQMQNELGWSAEELAQQKARVQEFIKKESTWQI